MTEPLPESVEGFLDGMETSEKTLLVLNRTEPEPLINLFERGLDDQPVSVADRQLTDGVDDLVCLLDDGEVVATSPLERLQEAYLLVNADRYRTGTRQIEVGSFPDVLTGLDGVEFSVRGYPGSAKEKLLLVLISRFIEFRALQHGAGTLRSTFQRLSRLDDEFGTRRVYDWLVEAGVDTHVYGVNDDPETVADLGVTAHAGSDDDYRRSWVVCFRPSGRDDPRGEDAEHVALIASEIDSNVWRGAWTYDPGLVARVDAYLRETF